MDTICEPSLFNERTRGFTARVIAFATPPVHPRDDACCSRNAVLSWSPDSFPQVETIVSTKEEYKTELVRGSAESLATTDDILKIERKPSSTLLHRPAPASVSRPQAPPLMANGGLISEPRLPPDITNAGPRYKNNHPIALELTGEVDGVNLSEMSMVQVQTWCKMKKQQNSSWTRKWGCRYCEDHGEPRKLWCAPRFVTSHWRDECKYNPWREKIPMKESLGGTIKSQSEGVSCDSDNRLSKLTFSPIISHSETAISRRHTPPPDTDRIHLGPGKFGCRECDRHEDQGIVRFPTYDAVYTHFRTECKYGPSFRGSWPKSTLSIQIGSQTFGFRAPTPPPKDSDSLDDEWFYDRYHCYPVDYPVAVELIDISETSPLESKWTCRHCREYGEPRENPLRTWNRQGWVLNHWTYCKYNRQRQIRRGQGRSPVVMSRSQNPVKVEEVLKPEKIPEVRSPTRSDASTTSSRPVTPALAMVEWDSITTFPQFDDASNSPMPTPIEDNKRKFEEISNCTDTVHSRKVGISVQVQSDIHTNLKRKKLGFVETMDPMLNESALS